MRRSLVLMFVCLLTLGFAAACNDDDGDSGDGGGNGGGNADTFCELNNSTTATPTDEQLDELADAAPDEISDQVAALVEAFKADALDPENEELNAAGQDVETWITENCDMPEIELDELPQPEETTAPDTQG